MGPTSDGRSWEWTVNAECQITEQPTPAMAEHMESILSSVTDAYMHFDREWRYLYVNKMAAESIREAIGKPDAKLLGLNVWELIPDLVGTNLERQYRLAMETRTTIKFEFHYPALDNWWEHRLYPTPEGLAAFALEITARKRAEHQLQLAYDTTLRGWSAALDLRDKETEGHTQRVAEMTVQLGRIMGLGEDELIEVQRGALLHDIGKMGIPDSILLKPGRLTDEEWGIMRQHPTHAFNLLSPITYLQQALDIPYCHHEKWDGTGYPRGLKGDEIPLSARIFAVVDIWDALRSRRPYRSAWSLEKAREHIESLAGTHLDPQVVARFLPLLSEFE